MKKNYLSIIALLCVIVYAVQAKDNIAKVNDRLQKTKHQLSLQKLDDEQQLQFEMLKIGHLSGTNLTKQGHSTSLRVPQFTEETSVLLDSTVTKKPDGSIVSKKIYGYNVQGNNILIISSSFNNETQQWTNTDKYEYEYNTNNDRTLIAYYRWDSETGIWQVSYRTETEWSVDSENNKTFVRIRFDWNSETQSLSYTSKEETVLQGNTNIYKYRTTYYFSAEGVWLPVSKVEQLYDDDGYDYTISNYVWDVQTEVWKGSSKSGYGNSDDESYYQFIAYYYWNDDVRNWTAKTEIEYDRNNNEIATAEYVRSGENWQAVSKTGKEGDFVVFYKLVENAFVKTYKEATYYDENNNVTSYSRYDWDEGLNNWFVSKNIGSCMWDNLSGEWRVYQYIELGYDKYGHELYRIQLYRGNTQSQWLGSYTYKTENVYDEAGRQMARITYDWAGGEPTVFNQGEPSVNSSNGWIEIQRTTYHYSEHEISNNVPSYEVKTQIFPNPANNRLTISGTKSGQGIHITSLNGQQKKVFTAEEGNTVINLSSFDAGIYLVTIDKFSVKIVKE